jgi:hypothetical protein
MSLVVTQLHTNLNTSWRYSWHILYFLQAIEKSGRRVHVAETLTSDDVKGTLIALFVRVQ